MNTIKKSPLREWLGDAIPMRSSSRVCVGDWIGLNCGDHVVTHDDDRHVGRVIAIFDGITARVQWIDNGWRTDFAIADLIVIKRTD